MSDPDGLAADCARAKALGFQGKSVIHPNQIACVNETFGPSGGEIAAARRLVDLFEEAERNGIGAIQIDGNLVDYAMLKTARKTLETARALGSA